MVIATPEAVPLHLNRLTIENFMRVSALQVDADGRHVLISGPNASGKTSAVDAIWAALGGKPGREMPEPVHRGASKGTVQLDLGEYLVERTWSDKGPRLTVTAADGSKVQKPQALLDGLLGKYALDPVAFIDRRPQDQVDDVLAVAGVTPPVAQVEAIAGERHEPRPGESASQYLERLSADDVGLFYLRRREAHRVLEQKRHALEEQRQVLDRIGGPLKPEDGEQSPSKLLTEIDRLQQKGDERRAVQETASASRLEHSTLAEHLRRVEADHAASAQSIGELEAQLRRVQESLEKERAKAAGLTERIERGQKTVAEADAEASAAEHAAKSLRDPSPQIKTLREQVKTIEQTNAFLSKRQHAGEQLQRLAQDVEEAHGEHKRADAIVDGLRGLRVHLLDGVDLGVPSLEVGLGELRLNGVSFRQASQAEQIRTACAVAMRQKPRLRLLRVDEGERLDSHSRELLLRLADENGWQCIMTCVRDTEALRVEIVPED